MAFGAPCVQRNPEISLVTSNFSSGFSFGNFQPVMWHCLKQCQVVSRYISGAAPGKHGGLRLLAQEGLPQVTEKSSAHLQSASLASLQHRQNWPAGLMCLEPLSFCCAERSAGFKDSNAWPGAGGASSGPPCSTRRLLRQRVGHVLIPLRIQVPAPLPGLGKTRVGC